MVRVPAEPGIQYGTGFFRLPGRTSDRRKVRLSRVRRRLYIKSGQEDLNLRPHGPEPCALAKLSYAPFDHFPRYVSRPSRFVNLSSQTLLPSRRFGRLSPPPVPFAPGYWLLLELSRPFPHPG